MTSLDIQQIAKSIEELVRETLDLEDDVELKPDSDLIDEIGLDSIEAYEAIAALHQLFGTRIPKDLDPAVVRSVSGMSSYVADRFGDDEISRFLSIDIPGRIAQMRAVDTLE